MKKAISLPVDVSKILLDECLTVSGMPHCVASDLGLYGLLSLSVQILRVNTGIVQEKPTQE